MPKIQADTKAAKMKQAAKAVAARGVTKPKHEPRLRVTPIGRPESKVKPTAEVGVDAPPPGVVQSGYSVFNSGGPVPNPKETTMTKTTKLTAEEKAEKKAAAAAKKAEAEAAKAAAKAERERIAAERNVSPGTLSMQALRDAKDKYVKGANGQLHTTDPLAAALDAVRPADTVKLAMALLEEPSNRYAALNVGQQSMNYRNRLRGAIRSNKVTIEQIVAFRDQHGMTAWVAERKAAKAEAANEAALAQAAA